MVKNINKKERVITLMSDTNDMVSYSTIGFEDGSPKENSDQVAILMTMLATALAYFTNQFGLSADVVIDSYKELLADTAKHNKINKGGKK